MIGIAIANSLGLSAAAAGPDPSASAYFAATGITGITEQQAIDNLVKGLKADGLWSKMKAVYPFVTDKRNLLDYTEDFGNAYWVKFNSTVTANATTAPNGTLTADKLLENGAGYHTCSFANNLITSTNPHTVSFYAKASERNWCSIYLFDGTVYEAFFDLTNGVIGSMSSGMTATITSVGNGWYRCTATRSVSVSPSTNGGIITALGNNQSSYTGSAGNGIFIWGGQLELGSTATTYQPIATTQQAFISSQFKYNLVNPVDSDAAFRLVFNGGWTHSSNGATPNGTNGYADTKLIPSSSLSTTSGHFSFYSRTNNNTGVYDMGSSIGASAEQNLITRYLDDKFYACYGLTAQVQSIANTSSLGLFVTNRNSATNTTGFKNGTKLNNGTQTSALSTRSLYISALNSGVAGSYSNRQTAFATIGDGLTDTEAANLYTRVQTFNQALSRQVGVPIVSDADAQAFLNSAEITDITQANAINTLVTDLKAQGLWTKMKAIYPFVGGTASTHKYNLKDPRDLDAAYRLVFNGGWTHSSTGATPNGTNGYADTKLNILNTLSLTNSHHSAYLRTNYAISTLGAFGAESATTTRMSFFPYTFSVGWISDIYDNSQSRISSNTGNSTGYVIGSRASTSSHKLFRNGTQIASTTNDTNGSRPNLNYWIGGYNVSNALQFPIASQLSLYSIGDGLTDTEATALYNAVNNFQVALSRNI